MVTLLDPFGERHLFRGREQGPPADLEQEAFEAVCSGGGLVSLLGRERVHRA
jgi:hypothetical protein